MNPTRPIIHVVDDDPSYLKALSRLLRAGGYPAQTYSSASEFLRRNDPESRGCIIVDLRMPGQSGLELQERLATSGSQVPVIFLTGHGDIPTSVRAMRDGAVDFLTKPVKRRDLFEAIERALVRNREESERRACLRELQDRFDALTPREREVMLHVIGGELNKQIAFDLGTSERTIKAHRASIMDKLGVQSVAELVRFAEELGIQPIR